MRRERRDYTRGRESRRWRNREGQTRLTVQSTDPRSGLFRFLHHDVPLEWSGNVEGRLGNIRTYKPLAERARRLAAIRRVPDELTPPSLAPAWRAYEEAWQACEASAEGEEAYKEAWLIYQRKLRTAFPDAGAFALSLGPLPNGVTWNGEKLIFAS